MLVGERKQIHPALLDPAEIEREHTILGRAVALARRQLLREVA
jgi:hypothetical protein